MTGFDSQHDDLPDWDIEAIHQPAAIRSVSAATARELRGQRVIVGLPGLGWRADLRADEPVVQGSRTYVPVLPEQEWYRAESEQTEVFAPLVPIERVWVETVSSGSDNIPEAGDLVSRLVSLDAPPIRHPIAARDALRITGKRVVQTPTPDEKAIQDRRNLRAVTEPYTTSDGDICVRVASELEWYRWTWSGQLPKTRSVPVHLLWVE
jgi:hypothetical protein